MPSYRCGGPNELRDDLYSRWGAGRHLGGIGDLEAALILERRADAHGGPWEPRGGDEAWRSTLESHDRIAWKAANRHRGTLVKNTGDGLLLTFDSPSQAIACGMELMRELAGVGLTIRAGVHAGEVEVRENGDVTGLAVNLAARVQQAATEGSIYVSSTVHDLLLVGERSFEDRGEHALKGIAGAWRLYALAS